MRHQPYAACVSVRLTLVAHASTPATARAAFSLDEGLEPRGVAAARAVAGGLRRVTRALRSPATAAAETADALGLTAEVDTGLADWDLGRWRGHTLDAIAGPSPDGPAGGGPAARSAAGASAAAPIAGARAAPRAVAGSGAPAVAAASTAGAAPGHAGPAAVHAWLTDPDAAPHGGESLTVLLARVGAWLDADHAGDDAAHVVAVTHAAVVRAALVVTLGAPASAFWRIDIAPLTVTVLRGRPGRWTVRGTGLPVA